ncbi:hypothetical protein [Pseudonocardia sp. GCM10023141]|uniref:hypothetical protein n=1 Tax=Pseudonocardia sp. GCM10023141 TaxID=3252653 RepID=UPI00360FE65E
MDALLALAVRSGRMLRVSLPDGEVETFLDDAGPIPDGVVVHDGIVYWTTMGVPEVVGEGEANRLYHRRDGGVHAIGLDGTGRRDVVAPGTITTGKQLTCDDTGVLYWGDREGRRVSRAHIDGSGLADLVVNTGAGELAECVGVAVDRAAGHLYWSQKGPSKGGQGRILRVGLEVPAGETAATRSDVEVLWDGLPEPIDLHLDVGWLYWTDRGAPPAGNTLNRAPLPAPAGRGAEPQILGGGFAEAIGLAVDPAAGRAYVSDLGGHIWVVPLPEGPEAGALPRVLVRLPEAITGLAAL